MVATVERLPNSQLVEIILSGMFANHDDTPRYYAPDFRRSITKILHENAEHPAIKGKFHIVTAGAFPYSQEVSDAFWMMTESSNYFGWMTGGPEFVNRDITRMAKYIKDQKAVSEEDYTFLQGLGSKIEVSDKF